jgi:hypothetical protein
MITREDFEQLAQREEKICVSLYLPTSRAGDPEPHQLHFKNLLLSAQEKLQALGSLDEKEAKAFLQPAAELLDQEKFWGHLSDGLAVFVGPDFFRYEVCPVDFSEHIHVGHHYYLTPLIPLVSGDDRFYLLTLSQQSLRFFELDRYGITPIELNDDIPKNMEEALLLDTPDAQVQHHSGQGGNSPAVFHGQGQGKDSKKAYLKEYFDRVSAGIDDMLCDEDAPLLLAGVDHLIPIYRKASKYQHIVADKHVGGNVEQDDPALLHEKAWLRMADFFDQQRRRDKQLFESNLAADEASFSLTNIVPAALNGRVEALFVARDAEGIYGYYHPEKNKVEVVEDPTLETRDLVDWAATTAFLSGARVYHSSRTELPRPTADLAAIYRYNY